MTDAEFQIGERVFYVVSRPRSGLKKYLPATIINVTRKRLVIQLDNHPAPRVVHRSGVCREKPDE